MEPCLAVPKSRQFLATGRGIVTMSLKRVSSVPRFQPVCYWLCMGPILLLMGVTSGPAYAGWVSLGDTGLGTRVYVDRGAVDSKGNLVTMWVLYDFRSIRTVAGKSYFS